MGHYHYFLFQSRKYGSLKESAGSIQIFNSPTCAGEIINVPEEGEGRYWDAFKINGENGEILLINQIVGIEPGF